MGLIAVAKRVLLFLIASSAKIPRMLICLKILLNNLLFEEKSFYYLIIVLFITDAHLHNFICRLGQGFKQSIG